MGFHTVVLLLLPRKCPRRLFSVFWNSKTRGLDLGTPLRLASVPIRTALPRPARLRPVSSRPAPPCPLRHRPPRPARLGSAPPVIYPGFGFDKQLLILLIFGRGYARRLQSSILSSGNGSTYILYLFQNHTCNSFHVFWVPILISTAEPRQSSTPSSVRGWNMKEAFSCEAENGGCKIYFLFRKMKSNPSSLEEFDDSRICFSWENCSRQTSIGP